MTKEQLKQYYRRFCRWQQDVPHYVNRHEDTVLHCHNCGTEFADNFCPRCGQRAGVGRVGWNSIKDNIAILWGMDSRSFTYTLFQLLFTHKEWLPAHPEYKWAQNSCCMEWYQGTAIQSPDYQCGVMMPFEVQPRFTFNTVGLFTTDNKATVDFYTKVFGFTTSWDGVQPNVEMFLGNNRIILYPRSAFEQMISKRFQYPQGLNGTMELSLDVPTFADVDKEYQNALNNGAKSVLPPTTEPWGQRTCYVADPDGNPIEIGSFVE